MTPTIEIVQIALTALGVGVVVWWIIARRRADPLGPPPSGDLPRTEAALVVAGVAWVATSILLAGVASSAGLSMTQTGTSAALLHVGIGFMLLPAVLRGAPKPTLGTRGLAAAGLLGGLATFGLVGVVGKAVESACALAGWQLPHQPVVDSVRAATGLDALGAIAAAAVLAPFGEEVFFRGTLLPVLARTAGAGTAIVVQALVFGALHVSARNWPLAIPLALVGALTGWLYVRTRSIAVPIVAHVVFNVVHLAFIRASA